MALRISRGWLWGLVPTATALGLTTGTLLTLAHLLVDDLSRPGMDLPSDSPEWGTWHFPDAHPDPPLSLQRPLMIAAPGGPQLRGDFWAQPQSAPTIILSHGFRVPRVRMRAVAALEYAHGSNVLLFDYRGQGESDAAVVSGGNAEVQDLAAAVESAARQPETLPGRIFIHGFSMGAAVALLLPPCPEVAGIIADSPYARLDEMLERIISAYIAGTLAHGPRPLRWLAGCAPMLGRAILPGGRMLFRLRFHQDLIAWPEHAIRRWHAAGKVGAPVLLFHTKDDPLIPLRHAEAITAALEACKISVTSVVMPSNIHCGAYAHDPETYMREIMRFMRTA